MKKIIAILTGAGLALLTTAIAHSQTTNPPGPTLPNPPISTLYAGGISGNPGASPAIAGTGLYAHSIADTGTFAFTAVDALPASLKPFTVTTNVGVGIAQHLLTFGAGKYEVFIPSAAGISWTGSNTGWQWNTGAAMSIHLKDHWYLLPTVRMLKSSVSGGSGYQPIIGLLVGWGNQ